MSVKEDAVACAMARLVRKGELSADQAAFIGALMLNEDMPDEAKLVGMIVAADMDAGGPEPIADGCDMDDVKIAARRVLAALDDATGGTP